MNIEYPHYFLDVAHTKSITQAARLNFISPQGMSRAMNELEKELDCQLLVRYSNKLSLSPLGEELVPLITDITDRYNKMLEYAANSAISDDNQDESLILLCHNIAMLAFLPRTAVDFLFTSKELPFQEATNSKIRQIMTSVNETSRTHYIGLMSFFDNGRTASDDGIQALEEAGLTYRPYLKTYDMVIVSKDSPLAGKAQLTDDDIKSRPLITTNSHLYSVLTRRFGQDAVSAASSDFSLRKRMVQADSAHSFLPAIFTFRRRQDDEFIMVPMEKPYEVEVGLVASKDDFENPAVKRLMALLDAFYKDPQNLESGLYTLCN